MKYKLPHVGFELRTPIPFPMAATPNAFLAFLSIYVAFLPKMREGTQILRFSNSMIMYLILL